MTIHDWEKSGKTNLRHDDVFDTLSSREYMQEFSLAGWDQGDPVSLSKFLYLSCSQIAHLICVRSLISVNEYYEKARLELVENDS